MMLTEELTFASYPVFSVSLATHSMMKVEPEVIAKDTASFLERWSDRVETRGIYSTAGFTADADLMLWWIGQSADDIQQMLLEFKRTLLGRQTRQRHAWLGLVRPAEFAADHLPAFMKGAPPKKYACVYPFVRSPEWYLLDPAERGALLKEHGEGGREYPDVLANTTSAFGLGDHEWILAFEADGLDRIVELIRRLRATEARRYTSVETPFITGIRKDVEAAVIEVF
ncbi:MAG: chlorite dismutase family protein [Actinobacteria bacterium]|jgi:chlorite dismutase|nr:chlorite dismutase family protein [Actinomycetota bacterium]